MVGGCEKRVAGNDGAGYLPCLSAGSKDDSFYPNEIRDERMNECRKIYFRPKIR